MLLAWSSLVVVLYYDDDDAIHPRTVVQWMRKRAQGAPCVGFLFCFFVGRTEVDGAGAADTVATIEVSTTEGVAIEAIEAIEAIGSKGVGLMEAIGSFEALKVLFSGSILAAASKTLVSLEVANTLADGAALSATGSVLDGVLYWSSAATGIELDGVLYRSSSRRWIFPVKVGGILASSSIFTMDEGVATAVAVFEVLYKAASSASRR